MPYQPKRFKKIILIFILSGLFVSTFSFYNIRSASALDGGAGWSYNAMWGTKEFGLDTAARFLARGLLSSTINTMIKKIQSGGRTGRDPSFVQDWRKFLTQAQHRGEDVFRAELGQTEFCNYLKGDLRTIFRANTTTQIDPAKVRSGNLDPFTRRGRCTMPSGWRIDNFQRDFSGNGGWDALLRLAQPQNNFYGAYLMSLEELAIQRALDVDADAYESQAGRGFTGIRGGSTSRGGSCDIPPNQGTCTNDIRRTCSNDEGCGTGAQVCDAGICGNNPSQTCTIDSECPLESRGVCTGIQPQYDQARCTFLGKIFTPASLLGDAASQTIDKNIGWLITSDEISEVIVAVINSVMGRLNNFLSDPGRDTPAKQTRSRPPSDYEDRYTACVRSCNGRAGDSYSNCINQCSSQADAPFPGQGQPPGGGQLTVSHREPTPGNIIITADLPGLITASNFNYIRIFVDGTQRFECFYTPCNYSNNYPAGSYTYHAEAHNNGVSYGPTPTGTFTVGGGGQPLSCLIGVLPTGPQPPGTTYSVGVTPQGGTPPYTDPATYTCNGDMGSGSVPILPGLIYATPAQTQTCTVTVTDNTGATANCQVTITVQ